MSPPSDPPTKPPEAHAREPHDTFEYAEPSPANEFRGQGSLATWGGVKREWQTGSRRRVIRYYAIHFGISLLVGGIIGTIIGLAIRYT